MPALVLIRGGGDLASGVALRLQRAGLWVVITELAQPLVVRRLTAFAEAVFQGSATVEGVTARHAADPQAALDILARGEIPVLVDPGAEVRFILKPLVLIDARMTKHKPEFGSEAAELVIGLGPGFTAGGDCHAVVETQRGHRMGRVIWEGTAQPDSGIPDRVGEHSDERVIRASANGVLETYAEIGDHLEPGQRIASVAGHLVLAPFGGLLRGLLYPGLVVQSGLKIGDLDPRDDQSHARLVSDKSLAVAGGVLEAILSRPQLRLRLWDSQ
jgi:xanthine dehydrogenase accessory factor